MRKKLLLGLLLACCSIGVAIAQSVTITGKVTGDKGAPLAGVTVQEKIQKLQLFLMMAVCTEFQLNLELH
jgi:hypothetical protein